MHFFHGRIKIKTLAHFFRSSDNATARKTSNTNDPVFYIPILLNHLFVSDLTVLLVGWKADSTAGFTLKTF